MMYTMPKNLLSICVNFTLATQRTQIILRIAEKVLMGCVPERFSLLSVYTDDSFWTLWR